MWRGRLFWQNINPLREAVDVKSLYIYRSKIFEKLAPFYLDDDEYAKLQQAIIRDPEAGTVIRGSGGIRKLRWGRSDAGKRGGLRIIYYLQRPDQCWLLTLYAKGRRDNVPASILRQLLVELNE